MFIYQPTREKMVHIMHLFIIFLKRMHADAEQAKGPRLSCEECVHKPDRNVGKPFLACDICRLLITFAIRTDKTSVLIYIQTV